MANSMKVTDFKLSFVYSVNIFTLKVLDLFSQSNLNY